MLHILYTSNSVGHCPHYASCVVVPWLQVKAVVLRINSPGGSAVASDMIAHEVQLLQPAAAL
jgi:ATP-dependent protease ClpP protease subunit